MPPTEGSLAKDLRRQAAIEALAVCSRLCDAAEYSGLSTATLYRYRQDPSFLVEVALQRDKNREDAIAAVCGRVWNALKSADVDLQDPDPKVRESARNAIFSTALGMIDRGTLTRKAEKIEEGIEQRDAPPA